MNRYNPYDITWIFRMNTPVHVALIEDEIDCQNALKNLFQSVDMQTDTYSSAESFLAEDISRFDCIVCDIRLKGMSGLQVQKRLGSYSSKQPLIFITGHGDIAMAVQAMRDGAHDFLTKPLNNQALLDSIFQATSSYQNAQSNQQDKLDFYAKYNRLSSREKQIVELIAQGLSSKDVAEKLHISKNTVDVHRANVLKKMEERNLTALVSQYTRHTQTV